MTIHHCPTCHGVTGAQGTIICSDGKQEALYRCSAHGCDTVFSHALPASTAPDKRVQTYGQELNTQDVIRTDC